MGSFNTTCFVSQQTIAPNNECFIFPIQQESSFKPVEMLVKGKNISKYGITSSTCYPNAFWNYVGPMFSGKYDDYGNFELDNTIENKYGLIAFFNELEDSLVEVKQGSNVYHEKGFKFQTIYKNSVEYSFEQLIEIWNSVWEIGVSHRLFITNYDSEPTPLQFAVMHKSVANYLVEMVSKIKGYDKTSYDINEYFKNYLNKVFEKLENKDTDRVFYELWKIASLEGYRVGEAEGIHIGNYYSNTNDVIYELVKKRVSDIKDESLKSVLIEEIFELHKTQIMHRYIHTGLDRLNIKLSPMVYASQDYDNAIGKEYAKMIKTVSAEVSKVQKKNSMA